MVSRWLGRLNFGDVDVNVSDILVLNSLDFVGGNSNCEWMWVKVDFSIFRLFL